MKIFPGASSSSSVVVACIGDCILLFTNQFNVNVCKTINPQLYLRALPGNDNFREHIKVLMQFKNFREICESARLKDG
jgi:hypothetical protein